MRARNTDKQFYKPSFILCIGLETYGINKLSILYAFFSVMRATTTMEILSNHNNGSVSTNAIHFKYKMDCRFYEALKYVKLGVSEWTFNTTPFDRALVVNID